MSKELNLEVGKSYRTRGGWQAKVLKVSRRGILCVDHGALYGGGGYTRKMGNSAAMPLTMTL